MAFLLVLSCLALLTFTAAQNPPIPTGLTTKQVPNHPGLSLSYKETHLCETSAKAWAGYIHMPSGYLADTQDPSDPYNVSMWFWYVEARNDPQNAPTAIYLAGGPGSPSSLGAVQDSGPCIVLRDGNSTETNPWSFNANVNMLYVDQPVTTGFSYQEALNSTLNLLLTGVDTGTGITAFDDYHGSVPKANTTFLHGLMTEQNPAHMPNNTVIAARALWHFSQVFFTEFSEYQTSDDRINIWGNSYGGYWVTTSTAYFQRQNEKIQRGELQGKSLRLDAILITNGCIDQLYQGEWYPQMAYNNTYGFKAIPKAVYEQALHNFTKSGGCQDQIIECRELGSLYDPEELAINKTVNEVCVAATGYCVDYVLGAFEVYSDRSAFDMSVKNPSPWTPTYNMQYMNQPWVQQAFAAEVNSTGFSLLINDYFFTKTGDPIRRAGLKDIEYLLDSGIKVALVYGDRDYRCPWLGTEKMSLAANWSGAAAYRDAGYEELHVNSTYKGGVVKQHGLLSFTRVFESGHDVSFYQPETLYRVWSRLLSNKDIPTGQKDNGNTCNYTTHGPTSSYGWRDVLPPSPKVDCNLWSVASACTVDQYEALLNGTAEIENSNVLKPVGGGGVLPGVGL